ncbi:MAG: hypothetical protein ABSA53_01575 [Streptosporangiaceae bacterium]|jgi:hypothetical protein
MQSVKVRRSPISAEQAAEVIRHRLGGDYQVEADGETVLRVRKGLARAKVSLRGEPGGTVFDVQGEGSWAVLPVFNIYTRMLNERGIARRTATALSEAEAFRDDS